MNFTKNTFYWPLLCLAFSLFILKAAIHRKEANTTTSTEKGEKDRSKELNGGFRQANMPIDQNYPITAASLYNLAI
ncbi:hypothetical protein D3H65_21870 [Paraflavitalea soli]|uniref:Uncharacterized protein n=1 Tax=Paraflavitalea soli TaxID=2315862 RepID=A0A3B7MPQ7_9BACT|nr:hypothetical protein [Paraflavitalea soli]AXY76482.1 hypothetical protein D3H65_21870 [Paraflavitalea soli]